MLIDQLLLVWLSQWPLQWLLQLIFHSLALSTVYLSKSLKRLSSLSLTLFTVKVHWRLLYLWFSILSLLHKTYTKHQYSPLKTQSFKTFAVTFVTYLQYGFTQALWLLKQTLSTSIMLMQEVWENMQQLRL